MKRININPRSDWKSKVENSGFDFHTIDNLKYWDESVYYEFSSKQIDILYDAANECHKMAMLAVEKVISEKLYDKLNIPSFMIPIIEKHWENDSYSLYGRFDFIYDGINPPKMLEYNADTPTSLLEASVIQWDWLKDVFKDDSIDQYNSIHEQMYEHLKWLIDNNHISKNVHLACCTESTEDYKTTLYIQDILYQLGLKTELLDIEEIGFDGTDFVGLNDDRIETLFKLYPWEFMWNEEYIKYVNDSNTIFLEPAWKCILSNKGILPILYEMFPDSPYLLKSSFDSVFENNYVRKPFHSREGSNILMVKDGEIIESDGAYYPPYIYQQLYDQKTTNNHPVLGLWIVGDTPCGLGIREDSSRITGNLSRFVPHIIKN